jgi:hypothetical protein
MVTDAAVHNVNRVLPPVYMGREAKADMQQMSAEFRQRGGEVYLPADSVVAAEAGVEAEETVAAD